MSNNYIHKLKGLYKCIQLHIYVYNVYIIERDTHTLLFRQSLEYTDCINCREEPPLKLKKEKVSWV